MKIHKCSKDAVELFRIYLKGANVTMKKWICAMLCIVIMMAELPAFAAISYTLPQKMEKQLAIGSGLKGSFCFQGKGDNPLLLFLPFLQNTEIQIQGLRSGDEFHYSF